MNKYKKGQLVRLKLEGKMVDGIIVRSSGSAGKVVGKYLNREGLFIIEGELIDRIDSENFTNVILKQFDEILPLKKHLESEDIDEIKWRIKEWLNEFK